MDFEFAILDFIATLHTDLLDAILPVISSFGNAGIGWIILSAILLLMPRYRKAGLTMALALIFCLLIGNVTLKPLIARARPYSYFPDMVLLIPPLDDFSFPSGAYLCLLCGSHCAVPSSQERRDCSFLTGSNHRLLSAVSVRAFPQRYPGRYDFRYCRRLDCL